MQDSVETTIALQAAFGAIQKLPAWQLTLHQVVETAVPAALEADRHRIAERLRARLMRSLHDGLPPELSMKVQDMLLILADQIEQGMPFQIGDSDDE